MRQFWQAIARFFTGASAGVKTQPIQVNLDAGARVSHAFYRLDAIKRAVKAKYDEGRAVDPKRMAEYRAEVRELTVFLYAQKAIGEADIAVIQGEVLPGERF